MFDAILKPKFYSKCKTAIKFTKTRLDAINKKRNAVEKYLKKDIADLLKDGLDYKAYGRAGGLLVEQNMSCCYRLIQQFCGSISSNLSVMQKERDCPEECREAVSSLMFAAARFADLPELRELRSLFTEKYGTCMEGFVNKEFVGRFKAGPPSKDVKLGLMLDIALENSLPWDSKALEQKLFTPPPTVQESPKYAIPKETEDGLHGRNRRERRDFVMEGEIDSVGSKFPYTEPRRNDMPSQFNRPKETDDTALKPSGKCEEEQEQKETNHSRKPSYRDIPPPYSKAKPEKEKNVAEEGEVREDEPVQEAKPKPRSVRQRRGKLHPGHEAEQSSNATKTSDGNDKVDEEERVIDGLLMYYCRKPSSPCEPSSGLDGSIKPSPLKESNLSRDSSHSRGHKGGKPEIGAPPARAASFPAEVASPTELDKTAKGHYRADSLQKEMFPGHVHPNLPDYDDLASTIAALGRR